MKKYKVKYFNIIKLLFIILLIINTSFSLIKIIYWLKDNQSTKRQINSLETVKIIEKKDNDNTEIIEDNIKNNIYWNYLNINLIYVDFEELKLINSDIIGWVQLLGTNINYPFVKANNNKYYLNHSIDKSYNEAGWIFLDYRNNLNDKNIILYAHGRIDKTMFGSLRTIFSSNWYYNKNNYFIKTATNKELCLWQVFSLYKIKNTSDYLQIDFKDNEFSLFINKLKNRSYYNFNIEVLENDKIITLSTCYNQFEKIVMHAKLIKKEDLQSSK